MFSRKREVSKITIQYKILPLAAFAALLFCAPTFGQRYAKTEKSAGGKTDGARPSLAEGGYQANFQNFPKPIKRLEQLPPDVLSDLTEYLEARLGRVFFKRLEFYGGEIIELEIERVKPEPYLYKHRVYELFFKFSDLKNGLKSYFFKIGKQC